MRGVEGKTGKNGFGFSYALLAVGVVIYLGAWAYSSYAADWRAKTEVPKIDPILKIIKGLRQYQRINATFPASFHEVESKVWKHSTQPNYGADGRSLTFGNYYYLYTRISATRCTLWAIPVGPNTEESNSYFLILTPDDREKWKGPPLSLKEASTISGVPTYAQLGIVGMVKQDSPPQPRR